jgi:hypothetical protein
VCARPFRSDQIIVHEQEERENGHKGPFKKGSEMKMDGWQDGEGRPNGRNLKDPNKKMDKKINKMGMADMSGGGGA